MTRTALKGIVKECLVELLAEGLGDTATAPIVESRKRDRQRKAMLVEESRLTAQRKKFETRVSDAVSSATDDPVLQGILAETARTTLQEQVSNEQPGERSLGDFEDPGTTSSSAGINLDSIFDSPKQNWADLAFTKNKTE